MTTKNPYRHVGRSPLRKEAREKVTGASLYIDDISYDNLLHGRTVRSRVAHGKIRSIKFEEGVDWSEFIVVTAKDIPGLNGVTLLDTGQPFLARHTVRHVTEPIVLIAHPDEDLVQKAVNLITIEIDPIAAIFSIDEGLEARVKLHGDDNLYSDYSIESGDPSSRWDNCHLVLEDIYETAAQEQLYIEPQGVVVSANADSGVVVTGSLQCPYYVQKALMPLFDLPPDKVRIIQAETGGAFGGKEEYPNMIAGHAALLSWKAGGRPVKMIYDRSEDLQVTPKRHPSRTRVKAGFDADGHLLALDIGFDLNGGAYKTLTPVVLSRGLLHSFGPYRCDDSRVRARAVATNCFPFGAFRGFGAPQSVFAIELHMTKAASRLGIDPAEIRRRNFLREGDVMPTGQVLKEHVDLDRLLDKALGDADYEKKRKRYEIENAQGGPVVKGIGICTFFHGSGFTGNGEAVLASKLGLKLLPGGKLEIMSANVEYGQGTKTILSQIAAESCAIPYEWIEVHQPDTMVVPNSGPTVASRTTMIIGKLVTRACTQLLDALRDKGSLGKEYDADTFKTAADAYLAEHGALELVVDYEKPSDVTWDPVTYRGEPYSAYSWCCDIADIEIDRLTGEIRVMDFVSVVECGQVIHPLLAEGQIEGGVAQAIGFAIYEDVILKDGAMANHTFTNYIIPTTADLPRIRVSFIEFPPDNYGPFQAKGIGELPTDGPAAAIAGAVGQSLNEMFINRIPIFPEHILDKIPEIASASETAT